jgi:sec-independent protein translocase protein TatA
MFGLGIPELLIIFFIVLLLFGAKRLPEAGAGLGKAIRSFKDALTGPAEKEIEPTPEKKQIKG